MPQLLLVRKQEAVEPRQTLKATVHQCPPLLVSYQHYAEDHLVLLMYVNMPAICLVIVFVANNVVIVVIVVVRFSLHWRVTMYMDDETIPVIHYIMM